MALKLDTPVQFIKGVGPKLGEVLQKKGVSTVQDLFEWYPRAYEDRREARNIASLIPDETVSLKAEVLNVSSFTMGKSTRKIYDVTLRDGSGKIHCKFFRVPYRGYFERFQPGQVVRVIGKVTHYRGQIEFHHPDIQDTKAEADAENTQADPNADPGSSGDQLIPIYPESEGLSNRQIRKLVQTTLAEIKVLSMAELSGGLAAPKTNRYGGAVAFGGPGTGPKLGRSALGGRLPTSVRSRREAKLPMASDAPPLIEKLPPWLRDKYQLVGRFEALENVHIPPKDAGVEFIDSTSKFHRRIIFEEFFWLELYLAARKVGIKREGAPAFASKLGLIDQLKKKLPFTLTGAQQRSFDDILRDVTQPHPMHRLIQGDVGSGKTLVALMASLVAIENHFQAAIMVPTEILAEQHDQNARKFLEPLGIKVGLLTGSMKQSERNQTYEALKNGSIQVCVGTHALIQEAVEFANLGLVIIDEQHRFGVHQRSQLKQKGVSPHFLVMTATPIPRTLAMTVYGDLDVSVIDELPPGRSPIQTRVTYDSKRPQVMKFLGEQIAKGRQAYVVYPLVEESEKIDLKNAVSECERIKTEMPNVNVGLLHGKMKSDEKDAVMREFRNGLIQVLVSTTVIEVGVDVPNANMMIIEHAERFGLSQMHQLRGRVGRGEHKSFCILVMGHAVSDDSRARCEIMEKTSDGFKIAEADLEIRGPGEFLGSRQSGLSGFKMANLIRDIKILQEARAAAFEAFARDPHLMASENEQLRAELLRTHGATTLASVG